MASVHPVSTASRLSGSRHAYSTDKLLAFDAYARSTPRWRLALVILGTPLPSLLPPLHPLADPALGVLKNPGFCVHFVIVMGITVFGAIIQGRAVTSLPHREFTTSQAIAVSLLSSSHLLAVTILIARLWRFPVPFTWATDFVPWVLCIVWSNMLIFGRRLFTGALRRSAITFLPSFMIQISQILLYPAFSAVFGFINEFQQVLLTLCFPVIKFFIKKLLRVWSLSLHEYSAEVAVSGVEICAAMYQSQIMQNTPSYVATAVIMGVDMIQGIASVKLFMDKKNEVVKRHEIVDSAIRVLREAQCRATSPESITAGSDQSTSSLRQPRLEQVAPQPSSREAMKLDAPSSTVVQHALEIMNSAESILLVEYFEVAIPVVNGLFLAVASQVDSARYNPSIRPFYHNHVRLRSAMVSLALYSLLQGLSVVAMVVVMWYRYRLSGIAHLAYVLERHQWSLQGKLFSWLAVFFNFTVMHYGTDFKFQFDFSMPNES